MGFLYKITELFSQGVGLIGNNFEDDYEDSVDEYEDEDDNNGSNSDTTNRRIDFGRRQKPFLSPVTPYPPVYCKVSNPKPNSNHFSL